VRISFNILNNRTNLIILLGGGSGTGKSQISTALATHLGLSQILSTDSIRHILRNFLDKDKNPYLFMSTYETHKCVGDEEIEMSDDLRDDP
jgi:2-phosphoglycerate kinase